MKDLKRKLRSVIELARNRGPESEVSKGWLLRTASRYNNRFRKSSQIRFTEEAEYTKIEVDDELFLWPRDISHYGILIILSEILTPEHPHQYIYGKTNIDANDVVLDIGASEGAFSAVVTSKCKHVIAVEPSRTMCKLIPKLFATRNEQCPEMISCLLGSEPGTAYFVESVDNPGESRIVTGPVPGAYAVPVRTLDELVQSLEQKPTFIKCDAEGAEPEIFKGGLNFLRQFHPKLAITTYHNNADYSVMHDLLTSIGYHVEGKGFLYSPGEGKLRVQMIHAW